MAAELLSRFAACGRAVAGDGRTLDARYFGCSGSLQRRAAIKGQPGCDPSHLAATGVIVDVVVIDDGSGDNTWETLRDLTGGFPELKGLRLSHNFGEAAALAAGLGVSRGRACVIRDTG